MKFLKTLLFLFVLLLFSIKIPLVYAQETNMMPFRPPDTTPILGQEHAYSVMFRGNGDAVVSMRAIFTNEEEGPTNILSLRIPRVEPRRVSAFQITRDQEPDYFQWYGPAKYQKAKTEFTGDTLTVSLPQSVKPTKSGSVLIVFSATGYAKRNPFGAYSYIFETFKVADVSVSKATVGVSVDSDLVLAGAKGTVNYRFNEADTMSMAIGSEKMAVSSPQLDQMYSQVGYGTITKSTSNLEPLESYTVKGSFADNIFRLYANGILIGLGIFIATVVLLIFLERKITSSSAAIILPIGGSFLSALLIAVYTAGLFLLQTTIRQVVSYEMVGVVFILVTIISIGIYGFLLMAPAILVGIRRGITWGLGTFGLTIFFLVINAVIMIVVLMLFYGNGNRPPIYNMMKGISPETTRMDSTVSSQ